MLKINITSLSHDMAGLGNIRPPRSMGMQYKQKRINIISSRAYQSFHKKYILIKMCTGTGLDKHKVGPATNDDAIINV